MSFVRHCDKVEDVRQLNHWLQMGTDTGTLDLAYCCLCKQFDSYYLVRHAEEYQQELDLELRQWTKDFEFFVGWHYLELFAVPSAMHSLSFARAAVFWNEIESLRILSLPSPPCVMYYSGVLFGDDDRNA